MKLSRRANTKSLLWLVAFAALPLALAVGCTDVKKRTKKGARVVSGLRAKTGKTAAMAKPGAVPLRLGGNKAASCEERVAPVCTGPKCPHGNSALDCSKCSDTTGSKSCDRCAHPGEGCAGGKGCAGAKASCAGALAKPGTVKGCDRAAMAAATLKSGKKVLGGVKLTKSTPQSELLASASRYSGKTVRIEGPIVGICPGVGCWIALRGPNGQRITLKADDGVVDFRKLAKVGVYAVGEGVFTKASHGAQIALTGARIGAVVCDK